MAETEEDHMGLIPMVGLVEVVELALVVVAVEVVDILVVDKVRMTAV